MAREKEIEIRSFNDLSEYEQIEYQTYAVSSEFVHLISMINKLPPEQAKHITDMFSRILKSEPKEK